MTRTVAVAASVVVDFARCERVARRLAGFAIPREAESTTAIASGVENTADFYFALVAICHQTSPVDRPRLQGVVEGRNLAGWDFLKARMGVVAKVDARWSQAEGWRELSGGDVVAAFGPDITSPERRAELLRDLGDTLRSRNWTGVRDLAKAAGWRVGGPHGGVLDLLAEFEAYRDPVRKKSLFLLSILRSECGWTFADPEHLLPPVDYHEVRGHLRLGTVRVTDPVLLGKLRDKQPVTDAEDEAIRFAVQEAIVEISRRLAETTPNQLHYLFWNVFRSHCVRRSPNCLGAVPSTLPPEYAHLCGERTPDTCPFAGVCASAGRSDSVEEHRFETDYY